MRRFSAVTKGFYIFISPLVSNYDRALHSPYLYYIAFIFSILYLLGRHNHMVMLGLQFAVARSPNQTSLRSFFFGVPCVRRTSTSTSLLSWLVTCSGFHLFAVSIAASPRSQKKALGREAVGGQSTLVCVSTWLNLTLSMLVFGKLRLHHHRLAPRTSPNSSPWYLDYTGI